MEKFLWLVPFAVAGVISIIVYVAVTQGVPAAVAMVKNWWNKGKSDIETLKADVAAIKQKVGL